MTDTRSFYIPSYLYDSEKSKNLTKDVIIKLSRGGVATSYPSYLGKQWDYHASTDLGYDALTPEATRQISDNVQNTKINLNSRVTDVLSKQQDDALGMHQYYTDPDRRNEGSDAPKEDLQTRVAKLLSNSNNLAWAVDTPVSKLPVGKYSIIEDGGNWYAYLNYVETTDDGKKVIVYNNNPDQDPKIFAQELSKFMSPEEMANFKPIAQGSNVEEVRKLAEQATAMLKQGGKLINIGSSDKNIIPEGALHAHKNNLDIADITNKGIPVISAEEGGKVTQHAEIEREEIIFNLDFTEEMERITNEFNSSDDAEERNNLAIELGKMATYEIMKNTKDYTGLIKTTE